jgi:hypothetical protein
MKPLSFRLSVLLCIALVLVPWSRPQARPLCYGCGPAIAGTAVGLAAVVGVGVYLIHRSHTSLKGCVQQTDNGLSLTAKDGTNYELMNAPNQLKAHERFLLRGHKVKTASGRAFRVDHVSRDYGACSL